MRMRFQVSPELILRDFLGLAIFLVRVGTMAEFELLFPALISVPAPAPAPAPVLILIPVPVAALSLN
jgi:hypothetical protein